MSRICTFVDCGTKCTSRSNFNYPTKKKYYFVNVENLKLIYIINIFIIFTNINTLFIIIII